MPDNYALWRKLCFRGNTTLYAVHTAIQTSLGWNDGMPHRFVTKTGVQIGKVVKGVRINERLITLSQVMPTTYHYVTYQYGNALDLRVSCELIRQQDTLPSPRLCSGKGTVPESGVKSREEYVAWAVQEEKRRRAMSKGGGDMGNSGGCDVDAVNEVFLGNKTIKLLSGMRKTMDEDEQKRFQLSQMCMMPIGEDLGASL